MSVPEPNRVLVVDDERINRKVLSELLEGRYEVILAKSGLQALERVGRQPGPDLILLDIKMPGMDGYEVLRRLKQDEATMHIPVIFITALDSIADEERGLSLGAVDYITKPFHPEVVKARVENHLRFVRQREILENLAGLDGLTGLANRRRLHEVLSNEWHRCGRNGSSLSVAMVDVDLFKQFNDFYGHARGDDVLKSVATALARGLRRPSDLAARYGGEEFVLLLPETWASGARLTVEAIRASVEGLAIAHRRSSVAQHVTVSIGGATSAVANDSPESLLEAADAMLYRAKELGRNRVEWRDEPASQRAQQLGTGSEP